MPGRHVPATAVRLNEDDDPGSPEPQATGGVAEHGLPPTAYRAGGQLRLTVGSRSSRVWLEIAETRIYLTPEQADAVATSLRQYASDVAYRNR